MDVLLLVRAQAEGVAVAELTMLRTEGNMNVDANGLAWIGLRYIPAQGFPRL
jgi:hypothetical protein